MSLTYVVFMVIDENVCQIQVVNGVVKKDVLNMLEVINFFYFVIIYEYNN